MKTRFWFPALLAALWVTPMSLATTPDNTPPDPSCSNELEAASGAAEGEETSILIARMAYGTAQWVKKNKTIPKVEDLAIHSRKTLQEMVDFFTLPEAPKDVAALVQLARKSYPQWFANFQTALARSTAQFYRQSLRGPTVEELAELLAVSPQDLPVLYELPEDLKKYAEARFPRDFNGLRTRVAKAYAKAAKDSGRIGTPQEVAATLGVKVEDLQAAFGPNGIFQSDNELKELSAQVSPHSFKHVVDTDMFDAERAEKLMKAIQTRKRLILTTAVAGVEVEPAAFAAMLQYAKLNDAEIIVYPANMQTHGLDPVLLHTEGVHILTESIELSPWLALDNIKLLAKQINPLMGLDRIGEWGQTIIVGSPKMHVKTLPTKSTFTPKKTMTTGAITKNQYSGPQDKYIKQRTSRIAKKDHVIGALILEKRKGSSALMDVESAGHFYARHIEFIPEAGGFVDLGTLYTEAGKKKVGIETAVFGDVHVGMTDERLMASWRDQIIALKPKLIVLHDLMDGRSINHHEADRLLTLAQKSQRGLLNLDSELGQVATFVNALLALNPSMNVMVVPSNHDAWLHNWLDSGEFMKENQNRKLGIELAKLKLEGKDVFKEALLPRIEYPKRVIFLNRGQDFRVGPAHRAVELGQHGDKGANGAKASLNSLGVSFGRVIFGHTHTDARRNGSVNIGTATLSPMPYSSEGTSSWAQSMAIVDPYGGIQVLQYFDGGWYTRPEDTQTAPEKFFWPEYPKAIPNDPDTLPSHLDQWSY